MLNPINKTIELADGRTITIETGKLAKQADGAVTVRMGNTVLLATVCAAKDAVPGTDFMPLQVEYKEKFAAFGLFSGIKNVPDILPEKEDNTDSFYMFASAFGDRKNVKDTEDDVVYMIKKQKAAGKKFPRGYMATGVEDTHYKDNVEFMDIYEKLGVEFERTIDHGAHNWEYCNRHVKKFLDWLNINDTFKRDME